MKMKRQTNLGNYRNFFNIKHFQIEEKIID